MTYKLPQSIMKSNMRLLKPYKITFSWGALSGRSYDSGEVMSRKGQSRLALGLGSPRFTADYKTRVWH